MPRKLRYENPGGFFHITVRGNARAPIHLDDLDYEAWIRATARTVERFSWRCHSYCAMPNHFHLLVETRQPTLSSGMRHLNGSLAQRFNTRYDRCGHVFQGRFGAVVVERESHFSEAARYIVLNPVRAGLCSDPAEWRWSSYRATAGVDPRPAFLTVETLLGSFADSTDAARAAYRRFVRDGMPDSNGRVPGPGPE